MNLLDALRYLAALEQHRHFGRAAAACHITQPALSNAIRALEAEFDAPLVRRGRQYGGLTPEGALALGHGHRMLHEAEALRQALAGRAGAPQGRLQIGAVPSAMPVAARFAARLRLRHPGLRPVLRALSSADIEAGLDTLALDLGLGYGGRPEVAARRLQRLPQYEEHCFVLQGGADPQAPFAFGPPLGWAEAAAWPLALLTPDMHFRSLVDGAFRAAGCVPEPALETDSVLALLVAVQAPPLAAVLPGALVSAVQTQAGLCARPLVAPELRTPIDVLTAAAGRPTLALQAALALADEPGWRAEVAAHTGRLDTLAAAGRGAAAPFKA